LGNRIKTQKAGARGRDVHYHGMGENANSKGNRTVVYENTCIMGWELGDGAFLLLFGCEAFAIPFEKHFV
jgi:hypothetical protein